MPQRRSDTLHWFVFDDRRMYRPGETIKVKGWLRTRSPGLRGGLGLPAGAVDQVAWSLHDSQGNKLTTGSFKPSALGGFDLSITLPKTPNLGDAYLNFEVQAGRMKAASFAHSLQIQEFRRPEYEVKASADAGPMHARSLPAAPAPATLRAKVTFSTVRPVAHASCMPPTTDPVWPLLSTSVPITVHSPVAFTAAPPKALPCTIDEVRLSEPVPANCRPEPPLPLSCERSIARSQSLSTPSQTSGVGTQFGQSRGRP